MGRFLTRFRVVRRRHCALSVVDSSKTMVSSSVSRGHGIQYDIVSSIRTILQFLNAQQICVDILEQFLVTEMSIDSTIAETLCVLLFGDEVCQCVPIFGKGKMLVVSSCGVFCPCWFT